MHTVMPLSTDMQAHHRAWCFEMSQSQLPLCLLHSRLVENEGGEKEWLEGA